MRILQIGKYWSPQRGGMETLLQQYSTGLVRRGHAVRAIVAATEAQDLREQVQGVDLRRCARFGELASVPLCPSMAAEVRRAVCDFDPHLVHLHLPNPVGVASWLAFGDRRPVAVTYHSDIVRQKLWLHLWSPWRDRLLGRAELIHTTSDALIESSPVLTRFADRCRAVPPGIRAASWENPAPAEVERWRTRLGTGRFLFVGRLVYYKGIEVLIEAVRDSDLRLAICGDGPLRTKLQASTRELAGQVQWLGDVDDAAMPAVMAASAGLVLPSTAASETFGVVQLEAMAAGLPLVVSRASAGVISVHPGKDSALFVDPSDPAALRAALLRVRDDDALRAGLVAGGRRLVREHYDADQRLAQLESLLVAAAGRNTAA